MSKTKAVLILLGALAWIVFYYAVVIWAAIAASGVLAVCLWLVVLGVVITTVVTWRGIRKAQRSRL